MQLDCHSSFVIRTHNVYHFRIAGVAVANCGVEELQLAEYDRERSRILQT